MESSFALLIIPIKQESSALNMKNKELNSIQKQNSTNQKVVKSLAAGMDGL